MLGPTGLGLLATSISVDKQKSDRIVGKAVENVFGNDPGTHITKIISDQYKGDVKPFQLKNSVEELVVNLPRCPSCPEETIWSSKCKKCDDRESRLVSLVRSKDEMNRDLQTRVSQALDEYSPAQTTHLDALSGKIREQGDLISSLTLQLKELSKCRAIIDEKDKEITQLYGDGSLGETLVSERNETIAQLERVIRQRDSEIDEGKRTIQETNDALEELRLTNSSRVSKILQENLGDMERKDISMKQLYKDKQYLESRVLELDSHVGSVNSSNSGLWEEKKALEVRVADLANSMGKTTGQVVELDSKILSLTQELEKKDATITALDLEIYSIRNHMKEATKSIDECRRSMEDNRRRYDRIKEENRILQISGEEESIRVEKMKEDLNGIIESKKREISLGTAALVESQESLRSLRRSRTKEGEKEISLRIKELRERDSRIKALVSEQDSLETQVQDLTENVRYIEEERKNLDIERASLEETNTELLSSIESQSSMFDGMKEEILSLTQKVSSRDKMISNMENAKGEADTYIEQLLGRFEECEKINKKSVSRSRSIEAEMTELRERYDHKSDAHVQSVNQLLNCEEEKDRNNLKIKELRGELSECKTSAISGDKDLQEKVTAKERELQEMRKETEERIRSHEERLSFKSRQYSDLVGEKGALERKLSGVQKSLFEKEEGTVRAASRISELENDKESITSIHKETSSLLNDKIYKSGLENTRLQGKLKSSEESLSTEKAKREVCNSDLEEKEAVIYRLEGVIDEMKTKASEDETFNSATAYLKQSPDTRIPSAISLNETHANLFWIKIAGKSDYSRMALEYGGNGKVDPDHVFLFWKQAFKNFDRPGKREIMVTSPVDDTPVPVSLAKNAAYKTWVRVRKSNSCMFEPTGSSNISKIYSKEFLLWLYIIHLDGLLGDDGDVLIPSGSISSAFNLSDMFMW